MSDDFPAAHSMDTTWFAVDRDGQVAQFTSGETGPVPQAWRRGGGAAALRRRPAAEVLEELEAGMFPGAPDFEARFILRELREAGVTSRPVYDLRYLQRGAGMIARNYSLERWDEENPFPPARGRLGPILVVAPAAAVREDLAGGAAVALPHTPEGPLVAVLYPDLDRRTADRLLRSAAVMACTTAHQEGDGPRDRPARLGLFVYDHANTADPYSREALPEPPVHVDQLSPEARAIVSRVRFEGLSFAEAAMVQPLALLPCRLWEHGHDMFLDADGRTWRPIPGREKRFNTRANREYRRQRDESRGRIPDEGERRAAYGRELILSRLAVWREAPPGPWAAEVSDRVAAFEAGLGPDTVVRVVLRIADEDTAFRAWRAYHREPDTHGVRLCGPCLVALQPYAADLWHWVSLQDLPPPAVELGTHPTITRAAFEGLWEELAGLRERHAPQFGPGPAPAPTDLEGGTAVALALARRQYDRPEEAAADAALPILRQLAATLTRVDPGHWPAWERVAGHLPAVAEVQGLRLQALTVLVMQGDRTPAQAAADLRRIWEGTDDPLPAELQTDLAARAFALRAWLPVAELRQSLRALVAEHYDQAARSLLRQLGDQDSVLGDMGPEGDIPF